MFVDCLSIFLHLLERMVRALRTMVSTEYGRMSISEEFSLVTISEVKFGSYLEFLVHRRHIDMIPDMINQCENRIPNKMLTLMLHE